MVMQRALLYLELKRIASARERIVGNGHVMSRYKKLYCI